MKTRMNIFLIVFALLLFLFLPVFFVSHLDNAFVRTDSLRRVRSIPECFPFTFSQEVIEASVQRAGGWEDYDPNVKRATVTELGGIKLSRPLTIAKKRADSTISCKHISAQVLDNYWRNIGKYSYPHIPEVLGVYDEGYYYIWVPGSESMDWRYKGGFIDGVESVVTVRLREEDTFDYLFGQAGFRMSSDLVDYEGYAHNIIIEPGFNIYTEASRLLDEGGGVLWVSAKWRRIDFDNSLYFTGDTLASFLEQNAVDLKTHLGDWKFELLMLAAECRTDQVKFQENCARFNTLFSRYLEEVLKAGGYISQETTLVPTN